MGSGNDDNDAGNNPREELAATEDSTAETARSATRRASMVDILRDILSSEKAAEKDDEASSSLTRAITALGEATARISVTLFRYVELKYAGSRNASGDDQLELDIQCDKAVFDAVKESGVFTTVASEETPQETNVGNGPYSLGCDPLDGSSIIDANFTVGSIFGIWPGDRLVGRSGREQVVAAAALYGPRTVLCIALPRLRRVVELALVGDRTAWRVSRSAVTIAPSGKIFAPGNLRATADHCQYDAMVRYWITNRYQLRYTGGMVPDVYHIFAKGKGIFTNVSSPSAGPKLRLLYEVAPLGMLVETAGGAAIREDEDKSVLDVVIEHADQRLGVCFGGTAEVEVYKKIMFAKEEK